MYGETFITLNGPNLGDEHVFYDPLARCSATKVVTGRKSIMK